MFQSINIKRIFIKIFNSLNCSTKFWRREEEKVYENEINGTIKKLQDEMGDKNDKISISCISSISVCIDNQIPNETDSKLSDEEEKFDLWNIPKKSSKKKIFWYFFILPLNTILYYLIPDPKKNRKLYPLTFILCMLTIGSCSYLVFWMVVIIGITFNIPEPIMGMTFLAAGGCMPEAVSAVLVARTGSGKIGVSNALGANSLNILFSLGLPWFLRTMIDGAFSSGAYIRIESFGLEFVISSLLLALLSLYVVLVLFKFTLSRTVGIILFIIYGLFATFAILMELDVFFDSGRCPFV